MASTVLSGSSNPSYTNNTGQNVRIIINYMASASSSGGITLNWAGVSQNASLIAIGRNLAYFTASNSTASSQFGYAVASGNNAYGNVSLSGSGTTSVGALPTEIMLAVGQTFSAACGAYNIVVIPENG